MQSVAANEKVDLTKAACPLHAAVGQEHLGVLKIGGLSVDLIKTITYLVLHLMVGFTVAYLLTGSVVIASGIALIEPLANAVVFYFHEKVWRGALKRPRWIKVTGAPGDKLVLRKS